MIDNNIIQSLGAGSGIDTRNLVTQLTSIERSAPQQRIDNERELTQSRISDFGLLKSALSTLQEAAQNLIEPESLFSKSASFTQSDALVPAALDTDVKAGVYNFTVEDVAQSQSLGFASLASEDAAVGEGTLTFNFGNWVRDVDERATSFNLDADSESFNVTIDSTNNTLEGLRDAINEADRGVQASIIFDGTGFILSVLAESGANHELNIVAEEGAGAAENADATGLSRFAFNADLNNFATQSFETQAGNDSELTINGLSITRPTNSVDDVVQGLTLDILKADPGQKVTITVVDDKTFAEQSVRDFVDTYNAFLEAAEPLFGRTETTDENGDTQSVEGSLANDALAKSVISRIRSNIASSIPGLTDSNFTALTNVGIRTELDGTISISEEEFSDAFENRFEDVQKLFAPFTSSSDAGVVVNGFNDGTAAGQYDVVVNTTPSKGALNASTIAQSFPNLDTTGKDYTLKLRVNGNESETITIPTDTYASQEELAAAVQSAVNADTTLIENGSSVIVTYDSDSNNFVFTSNQYGTNSNVDIIEASADISADIGLGAANGTAGVAATGTINGTPAFGSANVLLPALGEPGEGLALIIAENATSSTVNFSRGFAGELDELIGEFLSSSGLLVAREVSLESSLDTLETRQDNLDRRLSAFEERLMNQFIAMERIINSLNSSGSFLDNLFDTLPFTAGDR